MVSLLCAVVVEMMNDMGAGENKRAIFGGESCFLNFHERLLHFQFRRPVSSFINNQVII